MASLLGGELQSSSERGKLKQISMSSISNITNSQVSEIEQKLKLERDSKMEIMNTVISNRNSTSPEGQGAKGRKGSDGKLRSEQ